MARLIELDQASLFRFMMRRLGNSEDAADATQEAVRRVLASLATLRNPAAYRGWLYRIAINVAQDLVRTRQSERHLALVMKHSSSPSKATDMAGREDEELREKVRAAVSDLEDELRTTVVLRYEQGLSYEEIAGAMQTPAGTVAKRLHTAHQRLQQVLAGAGASGVLGSISQALAAPAMDSIPTGLAEALKRVALDSPLPPSALPFSLGTKGVAVLIALGFLGLGSGLVYWRNRVPPTLETLSSRRPGPKIGDGRFSASGGQTPARSFAPGESVPASASTASEALAVLKGFVRDQETRLPLPGAQVWLTSPHQSPSPRYSAVAGSDGSFSLEAPAGLYSMDALAPGYVRYSFEKIIEIHRFGLAKEKAQADQAGSLMEVQLETGLPRTRLIDLLPGGEIRGQVLDSRGNPVSGATVDLEMQDFKWVSGSQENQLSISYEPDGEVNTYVTDFRGAFRIAHLYPEGAGALRVTHLGFAPLRRTLVLSRTALETRLVLQDGKTLGGKVLNARGEAVENACLLLGVSGSNRLTASPTGSSPSGNYLLADLLPET
ncbi:MAG TPA: sigma-70 family RNA polymerase sigma factor, partial [Planctomycetota bacterium]|nr:sigma-70 family RNA polymerase sigma factor [Planctomycetota bacterium]